MAKNLEDRDSEMSQMNNDTLVSRRLVTRSSVKLIQLCDEQTNTIIWLLVADAQDGDIVRSD